MDDVLRPLFDAFVAHAYLVVFVGALIDATGLPFPGRLLLAGAGAYAAAGNASLGAFIALAALGAMLADQRSEERRVGKECRSRWSPYH